MMLSLRTSHVILVLTSVLLPLAWASYDPINLMLAVACAILAGMIVVQARAQARAESPAPRRTPRRRSRDRSS
jgi:hypothetical protein